MVFFYAHFWEDYEKNKKPSEVFWIFEQHISKDNGGKHEQEILHFYWKREDRSRSEDLSKLLANYKQRKIFGAT